MTTVTTTVTLAVCGARSTLRVTGTLVVAGGQKDVHRAGVKGAGGRGGKSNRENHCTDHDGRDG